MKVNKLNSLAEEINEDVQRKLSNLKVKNEITNKIEDLKESNWRRS
jgi:predicted Holliday junction resolvase-like endonuclease